MAYAPKPPVTIGSLEELRQWVDDELHYVARQGGDGKEEFRFKILYEEPPKPRDGMVVYADGTEWDPGSGVGTYERTAGAWKPLANAPVVVPDINLSGVFQVDLNGVDQTGLTGADYNKILFDHEVVDQSGWFNTGTSQYVPQTAGLYLIGVGVGCIYDLDIDAVEAAIYKNGTYVAAGTYITAESTASWSQVTAVVQMNGSTDYIEGFAYVPGAPTNLIGGVVATYMWGALLAAV